MQNYEVNNPILISGGEGFIGSSLVKKLIDLNIPVIVIDNNITSYPLKIKNSLYSKIETDVSYIDINKIPKVSGIIHLASVAAPLVYMKEPLSVINPNTLGTRKMIDIAKRDNVRLLYASTSEVYGHLSPKIIGVDKISENENSHISLLTKRSSYAAAKRLGEELILNYIKRGGDATNLRLFNVYGLGMDKKNIGYGRVVPNFFHKMSKDEAIDIYGDGEQVRSFTWIDDVARAIFDLLFLKRSLPTAINIGNQESVTINKLADLISKILGVPYEINYKSREKDDPMWRRPSNTLIKKLINWSPKISLIEGLNLIAKEGNYV
ncbi:NAD-dependent epimerase/dehydratase family protein [Natronospora cellulosivora (SeqCode)]